MLLSQGYLFCVCVCVFTPLVIPVPMVSVALERRVISSFWGVAHWDPGGVQRRGERKMRKQEGEPWELFRTAHPCTSPRNSRLHVSGVTVHFVEIRTLASASSSGPPPLSMLYFSLSVPFCLRLFITSPVFCSHWVWDYKVMLSASAPLCSSLLAPCSLPLPLPQNVVINWGSLCVHST